MVTANFHGLPQTTEIFSLDTLSWRPGPTFSLSAPASVPFEDSFIVIGGYSENGAGELKSHSEIYKWDVETEDFVLMAQELSEARDTMEAIMVPDSVCTSLEK